MGADLYHLVDLPQRKLHPVRADPHDHELRHDCWNRALLEHERCTLHDDATLVLLEWPTPPLRRYCPRRDPSGCLGAS